MFTLDTTIDAVQTGKKQFVNAFVQNESIAKALNSFIDAQTEYTKKAVKAGTDAAIILSQESMKLAQDAMKIDYNKFGEGFGKAFFATSKK